MDNIRERIEQLTQQINELSQQHTLNGKRLLQLIDELAALKVQINTGNIVLPEIPEVPVKATAATITTTVQPQQAAQPSPKPLPKPIPPVAARSATTFEEFIGKNVASKVGILVT